jgi:YggT family protein
MYPYTFESLIINIIDLYFFVVVVGVVMSWLVAFDVINLRNRFVRAIYDTMNALVEPALRPIRRILPPMGGLDLSPIVLFFLLQALKILIFKLWPAGL